MKKVGEVVNVTFSRRMPDGTLANIEYQDVQLTLAARQADVINVDSATAVRTQAQLSKESYPGQEFAPKAGDMFILQGRRGRVLVVYPEMNRVVRADITFDTANG